MLPLRGIALSKYKAGEKKMRKMVGVLGLVLALSLGISAIAAAADDYQKVGIRMRAVYVLPDEDFDGQLSTLTPKVSADIIPEVDFEYFFMKNISVEAIAGVTRNDIKLGGKFEGTTWLLPPTITVKYHPLAGSTVSPYLGAGFNVIFPFKSRLNDVSDFSIDNSVGYALQAGIDFKMTNNLYFNVDYKYLNADTKATIAGVKYKLDLNPNLIGVGVGYRF